MSRKMPLLSALLLMLVGCGAGGVTVHLSQPMGDFVADLRHPKDVCEQLRKEQLAGRECGLTTYKTSRDEKDCTNGMSPAGCFACTYTCWK